METEEIANNNKRIKLLATCFIVFIELTICNNHHRNSHYVPLQYSIISLRARSDISPFRWVLQIIWYIEKMRKTKLIEESEHDLRLFAKSDLD
ncbi:MAG: hypothetical protein WCE95_08890, partial [Nitrososphaeraceae archaeon]